MQFTIETERLKLFPVTRSIYTRILNKESSEHFNINPSWPGEEMAGILEYILSDADKDPCLYGWLVWIVVRKEDSLIVGDMGFKGKPDINGSVEIGYSILSGERRKGLCYEGVKALTDWAFSHKKVKKIKAECHHDNMASIKVLGKLGMRIVHKDDELLCWELGKTPNCFKLKGNRVTVTEFDLNDINSLLQLWNNGEVTKHVGFPTGLHKTEEDIVKWYLNNYPFTSLEEGNLRLKVLDKSGCFIGETAINEMNSWKESDIDIKLLPQYWGKHYGTEVLTLIIQYAFTKTCINALVLTPSIKNLGAISLYKKLGFKETEPTQTMEKLDNPEADRYFEPVTYYTMKLFRSDYN